jgi:pyruvate-ferredoxin/flavodoxin oxidoreductase
MTTTRRHVAVDGNEAVAHVAYQASEVIALYPITPSSSMGEWADVWATEGRRNIWDSVPKIIEMQSEGGAAGAVHGALQAGALCTTFTASQGLLLMIPNMYKIAGELTPTVFHVTARAVATHALSIFGDHSDVMAVRATGFAMLSSASVQEAMDLALVAHSATLESRIPFVHFFDGFRVSHEVAKVEMLEPDDIRAMLPDDRVLEHRGRKLTPEHPVIRGTAQNPDVFFQGRERANEFYDRCPEITQRAMDRLGERTGRRYRHFDYRGAPDADRVIVAMGSGAVTAAETAAALNARGARVGVVVVRLYRPFDSRRFLEALPATTRRIAVLDRTKEPGAAGGPLYLDCVSALHDGAGPLQAVPTVVSGCYGLASKEFTPAMARAVFVELAAREPKRRFTVGIRDDVTHASLDFDPAFSIERPDATRALFYGLGADGTVGANKNSIKIIAEHTANHAQGYFVYDSKKSGAMTISHLRFGRERIDAPYLIREADFVACHQPAFVYRYDMLRELRRGGTFLLNTRHGPDEAWDHLPRHMQREILEKEVRFHVIDASTVAATAGMGRHINTIMQTCFFAISGVLPREEAIAAIQGAIRKTYERKGEEVVAKNLEAVDHALAHLHEIDTRGRTLTGPERPEAATAEAPCFVRDVLGEIIAGRGDDLPVSAFPPDGTFPVGTSRWEKRNIALSIPVWDPGTCTQCGKCAFYCPHAAIRIKGYDPAVLERSPPPPTFKSVKARDKELEGLLYSIQVAPEDCTGCLICAEICPAIRKAEPRGKALDMKPLPPLRQQERANWDYFLTIPEIDRGRLDATNVRQQQMQQPLFEFSGACSGCGETPYVKLVSQLFGDRAIIANATGCSSIFGGNLPTTPWTVNAEGLGPAWANSLFEDNAEFGLGMRLAVDKQREIATEFLGRLGGVVGDELARGILEAKQATEPEIAEQRARVARLRERLAASASPDARRLLAVADALVRKSVWIIGGDGWAYDIGFGGLDHVLASGQDVNVLVLDTEVYSNTGGQMSKATPCGAVARFAEGGKMTGKKDLGLIAMSYGDVYVASVAMGARDRHTLKAFLEAESYRGPSLIIAYAHCIAHGIEISRGLADQEAAVKAGRWHLYRYDPRLAADGKNPLQLDSKKPQMPVQDFMAMQNRFRELVKAHPERAPELYARAQADIDRRWAMYEFLASQGSGGRAGRSGDA